MSNQNQESNVNISSSSLDNVTDNLQNQNELKENAKKIKIIAHHKYFTASFIEIINILLAKSNEIDLEKLDQNNKADQKLFRGHTKLRTVCNELKIGFTNNDQYDQGRIIKKIYKVITTHINKFYPNPTKELFMLKNEEGATVTIIPGLDMGLIANLMTDEELENLWDYMYMMYISSVSVISLFNEHKKGKVTDIIPHMKARVLKSGILHKGAGMTNPFIGLASELGSDKQYDVDTMFENVDSIQAPTGDLMDNLFEMSGVEKLVDIKQLNEQLKNVKQEDIEEATKSITKMLGAENDKDVAEVCGTLVGGIVEDLKENADKGIQGMLETAKKVSQTVGQKIDRAKMGKTVDKLASFMKDGESNLKNMKDDKGNPIGEKIMDSLKGPLEMAQKMSKGQNGMPDFSNMAALLSQVSNIANTMQNKNNDNDDVKPTKVSKKKVTKQAEKINKVNDSSLNLTSVFTSETSKC